MAIMALFGFGVMLFRYLKKRTVRKLIDLANGRRLEWKDFDPIAGEITAEWCRVMVALQRDNQVEMLNLLLEFMDEALIDPPYFKRFFIGKASHGLLQQVCYGEIELPY